MNPAEHKRHALDPTPGEPLIRGEPTRLYLEYSDDGEFIEVDARRKVVVTSGRLERPVKDYQGMEAAE